MDPQKELEYLREKVALLERCLAYERLLRDMREAAPKEPMIGPNEWRGPDGAIYRLYLGGGTYTAPDMGTRLEQINENTYAMPCVGHVGVSTC